MKTIIKNQVYCGKIVCGKRRTISYKNKTLYNVPKDKWIIVDNMREPIITQEEFNQAQTLLNLCSKERISMTTHPFIGKLYCPDCGELLNFCREPRKSNPKEGYYVCRTNKCYGNLECTRHYIRLSILEVAIVDELVRLCSLAKVDRMNLYKLILSQKELQAQRLRDCVNVRLEESTNRMVEVKNILASLYSDKALGNINGIQFSVVFEQVTTEYESLCIQIAEDTQYLEKLSIDSSNIDMFIKELSKIRKKLDTPDWDTFDKVIEKITVENKRIEQGREVQYINIYYSYIGLIEPLNVLENI